jgi:hypothetical protein
MLVLVIASIGLCLLVVYSGALYVTRSGTMSDRWLAEHRASRAI